MKSFVPKNKRQTILVYYYFLPLCYIFSLKMKNPSFFHSFLSFYKKFSSSFVSSFFPQPFLFVFCSFCLHNSLFFWKNREKSTLFYFLSFYFIKTYPQYFFSFSVDNVYNSVYKLYFLPFPWG